MPGARGGMRSQAPLRRILQRNRAEPPRALEAHMLEHMGGAGIVPGARAHRDEARRVRFCIGDVDMAQPGARVDELSVTPANPLDRKIAYQLVSGDLCGR